MPSALTGQDLLNALSNAPEDASEPDRIRMAGYVSDKGRLRRASFYRSLAAANPQVGSLLGTSKAKPMGRPLSYRATTLRKGHAVICASYLKEIGANPGSVLKIEPQGNALVLTTITTDG